MSQLVSFALAAEQVKASLDIVEVVSRHVALRKAGRNFAGLCPFHNDKKPSMQVSTDKQIFKCFSCGEGGDALAFIMKLEHKSYPEVITEVAEQLGLNIETTERSSPATQEEADALKAYPQLMALSSEWFRSQLQGPAGEEARLYLQKRNISEALQKSFGLGLAPEAWEGLSSYLFGAFPLLVQQPDWLETLGLASKRSQGGGFYDKFRHRLMVPILDNKGKVIGFGGRALGLDQEPKYLNSPETPLYHKSRVLYGLYQGMASIRQGRRVLLMEGYFDVLAAHQAGFTQAVATCGTAVTEEQLRLLARQGVEQFYLVFDSDNAGQKASMATIEKLRQLEKELAMPLAIKVVRMSEGHKDPDEMLRQPNGSQLFQQAIEEAHDATALQLELAVAGLNVNLWESKLDAVFRLAPVLAGLPTPTHRHAWLQWCVQRFSLDLHTLQLELVRVQAKLNPPQAQEQPISGVSQNQSRYYGENKAINSVSRTSNKQAYSPWKKQEKSKASRHYQLEPLDDFASYKKHLRPSYDVAERALCELLWVSEEAWYPLLSLLEGVVGAFVNPLYKHLVSEALQLPPNCETVQQKLEALMRKAPLLSTAHISIPYNWPALLAELALSAETVQQHWLNESLQRTGEGSTPNLMEPVLKQAEHCLHLLEQRQSREAKGRLYLSP